MILSKIKTIKKLPPQQTYDITIEDNHNFFINNHLIHNCDYTGIIKVILINHGEFPFEIAPGDKIAQAVMAPVANTVLQEIDYIPTSETRGTNGFGSTGISTNK